MDWFRKAPPALIALVGALVGVTVLALIGGFVALSIAGQPTDDYRAFINTLMNGVLLVLGGISALGGAAAAKSAGQAAEQTNGHLAAKDAEIADLKAQIEGRP